MKDKIELNESGIKCDNTECNYRDDDITADQYLDYVNKPCPECGENLLTEEDFTASERLKDIVNLINAIPDESLASMIEFIYQDEEKRAILEEMFGGELPKPNDEGMVQINLDTDTKGNIKVLNIEREDEDENN